MNKIIESKVPKVFEPSSTTLWTSVIYSQWSPPLILFNISFCVTIY